MTQLPRLFPLLLPLLFLAAPACAQPRPPRPEIRGVRVRVPSEACGKDGIAALLSLPETPRYAEGAPVVIHVPGGWGSSGLDQSGADLTGFGFFELRFAFPGGGLPDFRSGGELDNRGANTLASLRDLILYAMGKSKDAEGQTIQDRAGAEIHVLADDVGLAGWSNGGNPCCLVMALHGKAIAGLAFYASFESPLGEGAAGAELGGFGTQANPAYDPDTGKLALEKLAFDPALVLPGKPGRGGPPGGEGLAGGFYFDMNGNGAFDAEADFAPRPLLIQTAGGMRAYYSLRLLRAAQEKGLFAKGRPAQIPALAEAEAYWKLHDAEPLLGEAVKNCPQTAVIVYASERDHVQIALDHPHVLAQVEGFRKAGAKFIRLNPDRAYVEAAIGKPAPAVVDNPAGAAYDHRSIRQAVEPEETTGDGGFMAAAICELADRTHAGNWKENLNAALFPDAPRGRVPPARPRPR